MGIGDPAGILEVIERGVDMFDCVLPTRMGRTGSALTWEGRLNLRNARLRGIGVRSTTVATAPPAPASRGPTSGTSSVSELLGLLLLSVHNVRFLLDVTAGARVAIERGAYASYKADALARLADARVPAG